MPDIKPEALLHASLRHSSRPQSLFGSSIQSFDYVVIELMAANDPHGEYQDRHDGKRGLAELNMSSAQFANFVTSMNRGTGTPCTIGRFNGEIIHPPKMVDTAALYRNNFTRKVKDATDRIDALERDLQSIQDLPSVSKTKRQELLASVRSAKAQLQDSVPYITTFFTETMSHVVYEAKQEIDSHISRVIQETGIESVRNRQLENE